MKAYDLIREHYGVRKAKRSQVPLINHIDEGLKILDWLGESELTKSAFCLHPMIQHDNDLSANWKEVTSEFSDNILGTEIIMLIFEYRSVANEFLSDKIDLVYDIRLSPLKSVNAMLIADKVQNRKDFEIYHKGTHPRSDELDRYFKKWLTKLNVTEDMYQYWVNKLLTNMN